MEKAGKPGEVSYLFLGDYVDRGYFSSEVFFYLSSLKLAFPGHVHLLRGNHESRSCTKSYSFMAECFYKYDEELYNLFMLSFDALPLAAVVSTQKAGKFLCLHGGISPAVRDIISIEEIPRFSEIPSEGELCDLMWADPMRPEEDMDDNEFEEWKALRFEYNRARGISFSFGYGLVGQFLEENEITSIVRAHEVQKEGYEELWYGFKKGDKDDIEKGIRRFPPVITVFSAPNYCVSSLLCKVYFRDIPKNFFPRTCTKTKEATSG